MLLDRKPRREHMAFGVGAHKCVGMHLARQEFRVVIGEVLKRMPDYRLDEAHIAAYERQSEMRGWTSMPATFTPSTRVYSVHEEKVDGSVT
jgi:cytochrome P450